MIGETIDKYQVLKKIGEGGMATVYHGRHAGLQRDVAIKVIHPYLATNERNRTRFSREAKAIERLNHKNIVKIWDYSGDDAEQCYIITELVDGLNLSQILEEQVDIPSEVVALIGIEICNALHYAHSLGFIHRDIKPDNIMIRNDGEVKLLDFGIARFSDEKGLTMTSSLVGSPAYMSPEQAMDEAEGALDFKSDLFSLGIVLYQLVTGQLPYLGSNPSVVLKNIIDNRKTPAQTIAPQMSFILSECIDKLLQTNRTDRIQSAADVADKLRSVWEEAALNLDDEQWSLRFWLTDPNSYQQRLNEHLQGILLSKGRHFMEIGAPLEAQRYLNRLLIINPDNDEVFELLQNIHEPLETEQKSTPFGLWVYALPLLFIGASIWTFRPSPSTNNYTVQPTKVNALPEPREAIKTEPMVDTSMSESGLNPSSQPDEPIEKTPITFNPQNETPIKTIGRPKKVFVKEKITPISPVKTKSSMQEKVDVATDNLQIAKEDRIVPPNIEPSIEPSIEQGSLTISIPNAWAEVWIDGKSYGRTGQIKPIELTAGSHELKLINPYSLPHIEQIDIKGKERTHIEIRALKRRPATLLFASSMSPECQVFLDDSSQGELGILNFQLSIIDPNLPHKLLLDCPDKPYTTEIGQLTPGSSMPVRF